MSSGKKNIVWLASYPKSGNTWVRIFLSNLLSESDEPIDINDINLGSIASNRVLFDNFCGVNSSDLTKEEIDNLRPRFYRRISEESNEVLYMKVHDAWQLTPSREPMFPPEVTKSVVYLIRHPLDVADSYAHHNSQNSEITKQNLFKRDLGLARSSSKLNEQLRQRLFSWEEHVISWTERAKMPLYIMKYESTKIDPFQSFKNLTNFLEIKSNDHHIKMAIKNSSFEELRRQEFENGFNEKPMGTENFFREGKINYGEKDKSNQSILNKFHNHELLKKYKYEI